jgi:hypothetical protein
MKTIQITGMILSAVFLSSMCRPADNKGPVNFLNTPLSLTFAGKSYGLTWSSHPSATYYKQEYLMKGETPDRYSSMLMLEVLTSDLSPADALAAKVAELRKMKLVNPYVSFHRTEVPAQGEQILEFTLTANGADGKEISIAERNIYRYTSFMNAKGEKGLLLFAMSYRSYGAGATSFIKNSGPAQVAAVAKVREFAIPTITIK